MNNEQQILFDHLTRPGSPYELVQRREELHSELTAGPIPINRKVKVQAIANLFDRINPLPTQESLADKDQETVLDIARRLRNKGDDEAAARVMIQAQIDPALLGDRNASDDFYEREAQARKVYKDRRVEALNDLKRKNYGWSDQQAEDYFDGVDRPPGTSLDTQLRGEVNGRHNFPADRRIES